MKPEWKGELAGTIDRAPKRTTGGENVGKNVVRHSRFQSFETRIAASSETRRAFLLLHDTSDDSCLSKRATKRVKEGQLPETKAISSRPDFIVLLPSTVSGLLEAEEVLATLSARIGAASELPPLANADPDERVTRGEGLSAQFMAARAGEGVWRRRREVEICGD